MNLDHKKNELRTGKRLLLKMATTRQKSQILFSVVRNYATYAKHAKKALKNIPKRAIINFKNLSIFKQMPIGALKVNFLKKFLA